MCIDVEASGSSLVQSVVFPTAKFDSSTVTITHGIIGAISLGDSVSSYYIDSKDYLHLELLTQVPLNASTLIGMYCDAFTFQGVINCDAVSTRTSSASYAPAILNKSHYLVVSGQEYPIAPGTYTSGSSNLGILTEANSIFARSVFLKSKLVISLTANTIGTEHYLTSGSVQVKYNVSNFNVRLFNNNIGGKLDDVKSAQEETTEAVKEVNETSKGIFASITDFFGSFFQNLLDTIMRFFVPSSSEMERAINELNTFFDDRFGFLYAPFNYFIQLCNALLTDSASTSLTFPGFSIMGYAVWPDQVYDLGSDPLVMSICGYVRIGTGVLLMGFFISYLQRFFDARFGNDGN